MSLTKIKKNEKDIRKYNKKIKAPSIISNVAEIQLQTNQYVKEYTWNKLVSDISIL